MEKDLYLTEAPLSQSPDTTIIPQKERVNIPKSLANPNDRRNQISKKTLANFPLESYYDDKKIRPGISLYKIILQTEDRRKQGQFKGPLLHLNMHPTASFTDNANSMIYCERGTVVTANYISYEQYMEQLQITQDDIKSSNVYPLVLNKCCNGMIFENNIIMNNQVTSKIVPRSQNVITTKFIHPFAMYPNIIRLFFTPKHVKTEKKNLAYKVINRKQMTEQLFKRKYRLPHQFMVNVDNQETYIATLIKGKALQPCQYMAASLCEYLQHALLISINEIVIDFIVDQNKKIWFNDIKSVKSKNKTKLWQIGCEQQIQKMANENNNQIMCRLCGMLYTRKQMEKLVTNKLIYELSIHLENRGKKVLNIPHMKKQGLSNVCHLCYELIKAQHTLINVQREFSKLMNIRQNTVERVQSKETAKHQQLCFYDEEQFQALGQQTSKYKKWRLFFYIQKIKKIPGMEINTQNIEVNLQMKFQNQKEKFGTKIVNENYCPQKFMIKNFSKSIRSAQKRDSSRSHAIRIQSAMPHKTKFRSSQMTVDANQSQLHVGGEKNKSYFNDQTTCVTHSQSYFSNFSPNLDTTNNNNNISNNISNIHRNENETTHVHDLSRGHQLFSLNEDSRQQSGFIQGDQSYDDIIPKVMGNENSRLNQSENQSIPNIKVDKVKMFVFYTKAHENQGKNILQDEDVEFSLCFNNIKYEGKSSTLKNLKNKEGCQRHSSQVYLFNDGLKYCNLELTVGMISDGDFSDEGLDLEKKNNLFWGKTYSCEPLPDEWMEVFTNGQEVPKASPEKILAFLQTNHFSTSPPKLLERINSVNYIKNFQQSMGRPLSGIQSTSNLKKTSLARCKTAMLRKTNNFFNKGGMTKQNNMELAQTEEEEVCFDI